ncbi:MAG: ParB/RepB/Spo0J family partition protein [Oscillospiraceae bacterium]|nr:ParB/RepB/Spo0J family partition protein [Oscillospiraceae bacterium]
MKDSGRKIELKGYDDIFTPDAATVTGEQVRQIPTDQLFPFKDHPFKVTDDQAMQDTVESIKEYGVLVPAIARPRPDGGYELISGHRRQHACELAGITAMPVIVRNLDDDAATILMVDSNLQRENILPSERAFAFKMKLEAMKHQGERSDLTSPQVAAKLRTDDAIAKSAGISGDTVRRFIRLTELIPELLSMVDDRQMAFNPAVELSYLTKDQQQMLFQEIENCQATPSLSQAQRLKKFSQEGKLDEGVIMAVMSEEKKDIDKVTLPGETINKYFPKSFTPKQKQDTIIKLLEQWQRKRQQSLER